MTESETIGERKMSPGRRISGSAAFAAMLGRNQHES